MLFEESDKCYVVGWTDGEYELFSLTEFYRGK